MPAEKIIMEHYRLGSTRAILSRTFCNYAQIEKIDEIDRVFKENMDKLRNFERLLSQYPQEAFLKNKEEMIGSVDEIVRTLKSKKEK